MSKITNRLTFYLLILTFVGPVLLAQLLYRFQDHFHFKTIEKGTFITSPIPLTTYPYWDPAFLGKWQIVYVQPSTYSTSEPIAQDITPLLNQIHLALGKEAYRVTCRSIPSLKIPLLNEGDIGIVDPNGWLIMYYSPESNPQDIVKDVRRLLGGSHA